MHYIIRAEHPEKGTRYIQEQEYFNLCDTAQGAEVHSSYIEALTVINDLYSHAHEVSSSLIVGWAFQIQTVELTLGVPAYIDPPVKCGWLIRLGESYLSYTGTFDRYMNAVGFPNRPEAARACSAAYIGTTYKLGDFEIIYTGCDFNGGDQ